MTRIMIGFATVTLALAGCYHSPAAQAPVTTTSVTIPPATRTTPATASEPQRSKVEASGISFDLQTDQGTTADGRVSDAIYAGILSDPKLGIAAIVVTHVRNRIEDLRPLVPEITRVLTTIQPGEVVGIAG